jgi:hypothetical protein
MMSWDRLLRWSRFRESHVGRQRTTRPMMGLNSIERNLARLISTIRSRSLWGTMTPVGAMLLITAVLLLSLGCVKQPDWIESTLVTVDVTGAWEGVVSGVAMASGRHTLRALFDLGQEGPTVKGRAEIQSVWEADPRGRNSGPLEGRVGGDVFHFRVTGGQGETVAGEVTVNGDEMEGTVTIHTLLAVKQTVGIHLRRVASSPRPQGP